MTIINTSVIIDIATDAVAILVVIGNSFAGAFPGSVSPGSEGLFVSLLPDLGSFVPRHCYFRRISLAGKLCHSTYRYVENAAL